MSLHGLIQLPWWGYVLFALVTTHLTIVSVTLFLHRCQAHRALDLHPFVTHPMRFWLWFTTGQITREWVAIHRKHHAFTEKEDDPHSPFVYGINKVLWQGAELYREEAKNTETISQYSHGTPNDWIERKLYLPHSSIGIFIYMAIAVILFGPIGLTIWAVQMAWIPFFAAGVINGAGHYWGYRNFETKDGSTNVANIGVLIGGEELHNNHHAYPSSAKFSIKPWEFDVGWLYIRILSMLGLAKVKKVAPQPYISPAKEAMDVDTVRAMVSSRLHVMADYASSVTLPAFQAELGKADQRYRRTLKQIRRTMLKEESRLPSIQVDHLQEVIRDNATLKVVYEYQKRLQALWNEKYTTQEKLLNAIKQWCIEAEKTGIRVLEDFARNLRGYALQPVYNYA